MHDGLHTLSDWVQWLAIMYDFLSKTLEMVHSSDMPVPLNTPITMFFNRCAVIIYQSRI